MSELLNVRFKIKGWQKFDEKIGEYHNCYLKKKFKSDTIHYLLPQTYFILVFTLFFLSCILFPQVPCGLHLHCFVGSFLSCPQFLSIQTHFFPVSFPFRPCGCWCLVSANLGCAGSTGAVWAAAASQWGRGCEVSLAPLSPIPSSLCLTKLLKNVFTNVLHSFSQLSGPQLCRLLTPPLRRDPMPKCA